MAGFTGGFGKQIETPNIPAGPHCKQKLHVSPPRGGFLEPLKYVAIQDT
jgi:hypothetical protein